MTEQMLAARVLKITPDFTGVSVERLPRPEPQPDEVLVRMRAAAVNFPDVLMSQGAYQFKPEPPFTLGLEGAGEVVGLGANVRHVSLRQPVLVGARAGSMAQFVCTQTYGVRPMPEGLSYPQAAAHTTAMLTAYVALIRRGQLQSGEWLLVHGAAGGVGMAAVDLGRHLGARVIATASTPDKRQVLHDRGVEHVIDAAPGFRETVKALTGGAGADVIFDPVGGDVFDESTRCIRFGGRLLVIGFASGRIPDLSVNMPLIKGFSVVGVRAGEYGRQNPEQGRENLAAIDALAAQGLTAHIGARFRLEDTVHALRTLAERRAIGKTIIEID